MAPSRNFIAVRTLLSMVAIGDAMRYVNRTYDDEPSPRASLAQSGWRPMFVTIGDSYSSGAGIHTAHSDYEGGTCYRDWSTVPGAKYAAEHRMPFINKACGGAKIENVHPYIDRLANEYPAETANQWERSIFTVTAGGNDLETFRAETWFELMIRCVLTTGSGCSTSSGNEVSNFIEVKAALTELYSRLAQFAAKAKIRVFGYPVLLQYGSGPCWGVPGLAGTECGWLDTMTDNFNGQIYSAVQAAKRANPGVDIEFVSNRALITEGACAFWNRQINPIVVSFGELQASPATLHPTQAGYDKMLQALRASLA